MKKKILSLALALALCLGLTVPVFADQEFDLQGQYTSGAYTYSLLADGTAMIVEFNKNYSTYVTLETLSIPAALDGHKVTTLGTYSFSYSMPSGIKTVIIPEGVTRINSSAFSYSNTTTTSLVLPSTLQTIGESAFNGWKALNTLEIPASVTSIGSNAFFIFDPQEGQGLKTVICHSKDVQLGGSGLFESTPFDGCVNCKFYGYPGSTLEKLVQSRLGNATGNTFHDISEAPAAGIPTQPDPVEPTTPTEPAADIPASGTAYASTQNVLVDGKSVEFQMYALRDEKGNPTNYIKLRDLALILSGTQAQFEVGWNGAVNIETGKPYTPNGSEMSTPFSGDRAYTKAAAVTNVNGEAAGLTAFTLKDDNGGAYTYYQLRDLGRTLGFNVDWSAEKGVFVETDKPYTGK